MIYDQVLGGQESAGYAMGGQRGVITPNLVAGRDAYRKAIALLKKAHPGQPIRALWAQAKAEAGSSKAVDVLKHMQCNMSRGGGPISGILGMLGLGEEGMDGMDQGMMDGGVMMGGVEMGGVEMGGVELGGAKRGAKRCKKYTPKHCVSESSRGPSGKMRCADYSAYHCAKAAPKKAARKPAAKKQMRGRVCGNCNGGAWYNDVIDAAKGVVQGVAPILPYVL